MPTMPSNQIICLGLLPLLCTYLPHANSYRSLNFTFYCPARGVHECAAVKGLMQDFLTWLKMEHVCQVHMRKITEL